MGTLGSLSSSPKFIAHQASLAHPSIRTSPRLSVQSCPQSVRRRHAVITLQAECRYLRSAYMRLITAIREYDAKLVLAYWLPRSPSLSGGKPESDLATPFVYPEPHVAQVAWDEATNTITPDSQLPQWVHTSKLVAKPDQLIKRRGKAGLLALNKTWPEAKQWIEERAGKPVQVRTVLPSQRSSASGHSLYPHFAYRVITGTSVHHCCLLSSRTVIWIIDVGRCTEGQNACLAFRSVLPVHLIIFT